MSEETLAEKDAPIASNGTSSPPVTVAADATSQTVVSSKHSHENDDGPTAKKVKLDRDGVSGQSRGRGVALIKKEYLVDPPTGPQAVIDDDAAEASIQTGDNATEKPDPRGNKGKKGKKGKKPKGQNKDRTYGTFHDALKLCNSVAFYPEFSPRPCKFGDRCNMTHDLRKYLKEGRRGDLETLGGKCHIYETFGRCSTGWRCRFVHSHMKEIEREDGRKELVLVSDSTIDQPEDEDVRPGTVNVVSPEAKLSLAKKKTTLEKSDTFIKWLETEIEGSKKLHNQKKDDENRAEKLEEIRAGFVEPPLKPSEKRRVYFGRETPVLAPLTTQGNLPFRRLCVELGAQVTYSEMAMALPIVQGQKSEWALMKAHETEVTPPRFRNTDEQVVKIYDSSKDLKFGAQISGHQPWVVTKATEALTTLLPHLRVVDLNCGCPIDMVYQNGAGSALLDVPSKLEKMVRGMNTVSGEVPITVKLRTGVRDGKPTADKIIERMAFGARETRDRLGAPGCAAVTLHGRSRQQRYLKSANWSYIAECAALIKSYNDKKDELTDTMKEADESTLANSKNGKLYFIGNGDCYSHIEYFNNIENSGVDTVMIARGAMIKPWLFEEIEKGQYLDKSASERLAYIEKFVRYGLENWGSDELGIGFTRRFLLEWLSFTCRYIPVGLLEHLPPSLRERPPAYRGRNDLETLLASNNYKDWIKISEMFLGPAHPGFHFQPKHKSNSYEMEAEG